MALPAANVTSIDRRERDHFTANASADVIGPENRVKTRLDVNLARNQPHPGQNNLNNEDEKEWD